MVEIDQKGGSPFDEPARILRASDPATIAANSGSIWEKGENGEGAFLVRVLGGEVSISYPALAVSAPEELDSFTVKLLTVIYLSRADGTSPSGKWVAYRELPGARFYEPVMRKSVEEPLSAAFGDDLEAFRSTSVSLGGVEEDFADASYSFDLLPLVRICFLLWRADEEFASRCQALFDSNCPRHLSAFDLRMGAQEISSRLIKRR